MLLLGRKRCTRHRTNPSSHIGQKLGESPLSDRAKELREAALGGVHGNLWDVPPADRTEEPRGAPLAEIAEQLRTVSPISLEQRETEAERGQVSEPRDQGGGEVVSCGPMEGGLEGCGSMKGGLEGCGSLEGWHSACSSEAEFCSVSSRPPAINPRIRVNSQSEDSEGSYNEVGEDTEDTCEEKGEDRDQEVLGPLYIGSREVELEDGPVLLQLYGEGGLQQWGPEALRQGGGLAMVDMVGLVYQGEEELAGILGRSRGAGAYLSQYWTGFFPFLLLQLTEADVEAAAGVGEQEASLLREVASLPHRVVLGQGRGEREWGLEALARYHLHCTTCRGREAGSGTREGGSRAREGGSRSLSSSEWKCGGQCRLQGTNPHRRQLGRSRRKKTFFQSVRRTIRVRGGRGQGSTSNLVNPNS